MTTVRSLFGFLSLFILTATAFSQEAASSSKPYPTAGGAGGPVITVTSLEDSGPGSLREALNANGPRIIRFAVGGEIWLKDKLVFTSPFVTIEGESAPAPGITLMGDKLRIRTHDVIVRNIRVRVGASLTNSDPQNRDGIAIEGAQDGSDPGYNVLVENCSMSWAIDENLQIWGKNNHDIVVRNCIIAEGLAKGHPKGGTHSAGLIIGPDCRKVRIEGNIFAHNTFRNPVASGGSESVVANNLIYNPGFGGFMVYGGGNITTEPTKVTVVGNMLIAGANTVKRPITTYHQNGINAGSQIYYKDNATVGVEAFSTTEKTKTLSGEEFNPSVTEPPVPLGDFRPIPASEVEAYVLANAGALPHSRDAVDARIIEEIKSRTGKTPDFPPDERLHPRAVAFSGAMADYAKLLEKYATPRGIRYAAWKQNAEDMATLGRVVGEISQSKKDDVAFGLNAYNAWMVHEVLKAYPLTNVKEADATFFSTPRISVGGRKLSFNALENEIVSRSRDERVIFALNRASRGGPRLAMVPFASETLGTQLDQVAGAYINSDAALSETGSALEVSKLFEWQKALFPKGPIPILFKYRKHHPGEKAVAYREYDWSLDEAE